MNNRVRRQKISKLISVFRVSERHPEHNPEQNLSSLILGELGNFSTFIEGSKMTIQKLGKIKLFEKGKVSRKYRAHRASGNARGTVCTAFAGYV